MSDECSVFVKRIQETKLSPVPIIGYYVAAASLACSYAMLSDFSALLRETRLHLLLDFSCNRFALSTTWVMVLGVATKLTGDLTSLMWSPNDNLVKITTTAFLTMAMGHFFTQLGSMTDKDILINVTSLGILVITVIVDLCIQLGTGVLDYSLFPGIIFSIVLLFCMFMIIVSTALAVPAIKKCADLKYQKLVSQIEVVEWQQQHTVEELRLSVSKYWVMAASGSPHLLVKRNSTRFMCCAQILGFVPSLEINVIFMQCVMSYKYEENGFKISRQEFIIESYWTKKLEEWRQSSMPYWIQRPIRKFIYKIKGPILTFCIRLQIVIVVWCKLCYVLSFYSLLPLLFFFKGLDKLFLRLVKLFLKDGLNKLGPLKKFLWLDGDSNDMKKLEIDLNCFVILLEGEKQFPKTLLRTILFRADRHVAMGKKYHPQNLFNLLNRSFSFSGIVEFDSNQVPCLLSSEPPNCWTLPVVTLTSIAIALPNIASQHVHLLVKCVGEGLRYASLIDVLDEKCGLKSIKNAADVVWDGVVLNNKWLDMDLEGKTGNSVKEIIQVLADVAERIVMKFESTEDIIIVENPLHWPANVLAANSMYRISRTVLLWFENAECQAEEIFQKLTCMIGDILAACLINLPYMIATKCRCNAIEEREKSVRAAAIILEETEDILKHFEKQKLSSLAPNKPLYIDEWRRWMERQDPIVSTSTTINETPSTVESTVGVVVQIQS
nr:uncharacterized protein LOC109168601 [Ipomoea batatas]